MAGMRVAGEVGGRVVGIISRHVWSRYTGRSHAREVHRQEAGGGSVKVFQPNTTGREGKAQAGKGHGQEEPGQDRKIKPTPHQIDMHSISPPGNEPVNVITQPTSTHHVGEVGSVRVWRARHSVA